jgi:hypothetical protein
MFSLSIILTSFESSISDSFSEEQENPNSINKRSVKKIFGALFIVQIIFK